MVDPISIGTIATIGLGSTALSGVVGAAGSIFSGAAQNSMYKYQAGIAQMNAQISRQNAAYATASGETEAQIKGMEGAQKIGLTKAIKGASGFAGGTNTSVVASQAEIAAYNEEEVRSKAAKEAYNFEVTALQDDYQAKADKQAETMSLISGGIGAFSSILGAGGSFASKFIQAKQAGINPDFSFGFGGG